MAAQGVTNAEIDYYIDTICLNACKQDKWGPTGNDPG